MSGVRLRIVGWGVFLAVVATCACGCVRRAKPTTPAGVPAPIPRISPQMEENAPPGPKPVISLSARQLTAEFKKDAPVARKKCQENVLEISATVENGNLNDDFNGQPRVTLTGIEPLPILD